MEMSHYPFYCLTQKQLGLHLINDVAHKVYNSVYCNNNEVHGQFLDTHFLEVYLNFDYLRHYILFFLAQLYF